MPRLLLPKTLNHLLSLCPESVPKLFPESFPSNGCPVSYEPLHHKYRPQTFADLVGQEAITTTLSNAIRLRRIAPAYLFTGPRGTGKTSSARILSKSLNCLSSPVPTAEPCGTCDVCQAIARGGALDVIEIDAASNTGVDNIRELIERAQFAPVQCRYKIYCLDEVHMLSTAAFNALLKTLEEPPDRVVFILATTDPQRVLPTIISRCQRFDFRRIPLQAMTDHLSFIAQTEQIAIAPTAVELVAQIAQGGLRDAESLLDQLSLLAGEITVERVWDLVGSVPEQDLMALSQAIATANPEVILERTRHLLDRGREPLIVLQNLTGFYRDLLIAKTAPNRRDLVTVTEPTWHRLVEFAQTLDLGNILAGQQHLRTCEVQVKNTTQPRLWLEVTLLGLISLPSTVNATASVPQARVSAPSPSPIPSVPVPSVPVPIVAPLTHPPSSNPTLSPPTTISPPLAAPISVHLPTETVAPTAYPSPATPESPHLNGASTDPVNLDQDDAPWPSDPLESTALPEPPIAVPAESTVERAIAKESTPPAFAPPTFTPQPEPAPAPVPPVQTIPVPEPIAELDLSQIWQQLLGNLNRLSQALLSEHAQLISFKGREAQIGIRNSSLARIAQSKLPDVEAAFLKVFNRKVGVSLQIITADIPITVPSSSAVASPSQPPRPTFSPIAPQESAAPVNSMPANAVPVSLSPSPPIAPPPLTPAVLPAPETLPTSPPLVSPPPTLPWETYDELTHSARNFAQFFNGALVNLESSDPLNEALPTATLLSNEGIDSAEWEDPDEK
jgi:DNA polymerase III subunit gamma/tau